MEPEYIRFAKVYFNTEELDPALVDRLHRLNDKIRLINPPFFSGLRSSQIVALFCMMWEAGLMKD